MMLSVLGITTMHVCEKMAFYYNPELTSLDGVLILGLTMLPITFMTNKSKGVTINIFKYERRVQIAMAFATLSSCSVNFFTMWGLSLIPVGKGTLIFSLHPLFCILIAFIFLRERAEVVSIISSLLAFIGIYFLTINQTDSDGEENPNAFLGIILVFIAAWNESCIIIGQRALALYSSFGLTTLSTLVLIISPSSMIFPNYGFLDLLFCMMVGIGCIACQGFIGWALEYQDSSRLAPMNYFENVFTLLSDVFIFGYVFVMTDYTGIAIITVCLCTPAFLKLCFTSK
ncbi:unnamed protein product [Moneuplotes crassus]|uniref:EamA domain-containing protein n=1 Tax=Euplotes crassus TaxID=5936 RepID=A0AAD1XJY0_EUPCR|nr:unnamed protein product [Moneuplotes crassus]